MRRNGSINTRLLERIRRNRHLLLLALVAALSFFLNFWAISKVGYCNTYYAAAVRSMTESFHNFFFVSFDPAGMVSVDKPPLGLWVQALFVLAFGYHGWAMLLPQALAATGACVMMYLLTARYFGRWAGLISSLVFAVTPAVVVAARNNTMDTQLIFVLLVATWFFFRAIEQCKWRYLFLCALFVGLGFNVKMLQAYLVLPAIVITYLIFAKEKFIRRIYAGLISLAILMIISLSWVFVVELTPADSRPYVGSSTNNSVLQLMIGHNGLERLTGRGNGNRSGRADSQPSGGFPNGGPSGAGQNMQPGSTGGMPEQSGSPVGTPPELPDGAGFSGPADPNQSSDYDLTGDRTAQDPGRGQGAGSVPGGSGGSRGGPGGASGEEIGSAGPLRLWNSSVYGQASWLLIFTLFCILVKVRKLDLRRLRVEHAVFAFWVLWLATMFLFFSFAGFWHRYYLCMFAPGIAGLAGIGLPELYRAFREKNGWRQFLLPLSLLATLAVEVVFVWNYPTLKAWLIPVILAAASLSILAMALHYFSSKRLFQLAGTGFLLLSLLAAPFYWCLTATLYSPRNAAIPFAGPELAATAVQGSPFSGDGGAGALESYLVDHYREGSYLVVAQRANDVAQFIVDTGLPAVAYGGFLGTDNAMPLDTLKELAAEGKITYFLVSGQAGGSASDLLSFVREHAELIDPSEYLGTSSDSRNSGYSLYLFH